MIPVKLWAWGSIGSLLIGVVGQAAALDGTAVVFYVGAIGMAAIAIYSKLRQAKREQDIADREARKGDCEEQLKAVREILVEQRQINGELRREVEQWRSLFGSDFRRPSRPPDTPQGTIS